VYGLRAIHKVDVEQYPAALANSHLRNWTGLKSMQEAIRYWVQTWYDFWRTIDGVSPLVQHGFDWLLANVPTSPGRPTLLHSDYTLGNVLIDQDRVTAVLDWEASHLGDPAEELSTLIYNLRQQVDREEVLRLYREAGGPSCDEATLKYFEVFNIIKMMVCGFAGYISFDRHSTANPNFYFVGDYCVTPFAPQLIGSIAAAEAARGTV
jgi:aminoglycoside phosphotransferase (APT) family kinase protein